MGLPARDAELVQIVDAALAGATRRAGDWLVCRPGCTPCCHGAFAINALDVERLRAGMEVLRLGEPALTIEIERRAAAWVGEHGRAFPGDVASGRLGETDEERERFEGFANEAACPALDPATGRCDVYAWRPMTRRVFGPPVRMEAGEDGAAALGHCELCFAGADQAVVEACEMAVPHELEAEVLGEIGDGGETVVAFALFRREC
jgi:Fe-S-cluster containining protein